MAKTHGDGGDRNEYCGKVDLVARREETSGSRTTAQQVFLLGRRQGRSEVSVRFESTNRSAMDDVVRPAVHARTERLVRRR